MSSGRFFLLVVALVASLVLVGGIGATPTKDGVDEEEARLLAATASGMRYAGALRASDDFGEVRLTFGEQNELVIHATISDPNNDSRTRSLVGEIRPDAEYPIVMTPAQGNPYKPSGALNYLYGGGWGTAEALQLRLTDDGKLEGKVLRVVSVRLVTKRPVVKPSPPAVVASEPKPPAKQPAKIRRQKAKPPATSRPARVAEKPAEKPIEKPGDEPDTPASRVKGDWAVK